jgi:hypothetical protein
MFGCLNSPIGFQNVREVQGAFFKNIAKKFRFSAKTANFTESRGKIPLQFTCV